MSDVTQLEETTPTEEVIPTEEGIPTDSEPEITEDDIQAAIQRIIVPPSDDKTEETIPTSPQFAGEKDQLTETIEQLDELIDQTISLENEKTAAIEKLTTLEEEVTNLQRKVDFVDSAYEKISQTIWEDLASAIVSGEVDSIPKYLIPWKMDEVLSDKILWPLVQARLEWRDINIPKFLSEIVSMKKAALPSITSQPNPTPTAPKKDGSLIDEVVRLSNLWF